jgi:Fur family ferric uptake transcriptional regulator
MDAFKEYLSNEGLKFTRQRKAIAQVFFGSDQHLSLMELLELAQQEHAGIGYATVYRTMKLLTECGLASEHKFGEANVRYEATHDGEHHDHIICNQCGKIVEYEDERIEQLQELLAKQLGFEVSSHRHEIYGDCVRVDCPDRPAGVGVGGVAGSGSGA